MNAVHYLNDLCVECNICGSQDFTLVVDSLGLLQRIECSNCGTIVEYETEEIL